MRISSGRFLARLKFWWIKLFHRARPITLVPEQKPVPKIVLQEPKKCNHRNLSTFKKKWFELGNTTTYTCRVCGWEYKMVIVPKKPKIRKPTERISYRQPPGYCEPALDPEGHRVHVQVDGEFHA